MIHFGWLPSVKIEVSPSNGLARLLFEGPYDGFLDDGWSIPAFVATSSAGNRFPEGPYAQPLVSRAVRCEPEQVIVVTDELTLPEIVTRIRADHLPEPPHDAMQRDRNDDRLENQGDDINIVHLRGYSTAHGLRTHSITSSAPLDVAVE